MSPQLRNSFSKASAFLSRYHYTLFLAIFVLGIILAIYSLLMVVRASSTVQDSQPQGNSTVNETTIEQLRSLGDNPYSIAELPKDQRINLFAE